MDYKALTMLNIHTCKISILGCLHKATGMTKCHYPKMTSKKFKSGLWKLVIFVDLTVQTTKKLVYGAKKP